MQTFEDQLGYKRTLLDISYEEEDIEKINLILESIKGFEREYWERSRGIWGWNYNHESYWEDLEYETSLREKWLKEDLRVTLKWWQRDPLFNQCVTYVKELQKNKTPSEEEEGPRNLMVRFKMLYAKTAASVSPEDYILISQDTWRGLCDPLERLFLQVVKCTDHAKKHLFLETSYGDNDLEYLHAGTPLVYLLSRDSEFCLKIMENIIWDNENTPGVLNEILTRKQMNERSFKLYGFLKLDPGVLIITDTKTLLRIFYLLDTSRGLVKLLPEIMFLFKEKEDLSFFTENFHTKTKQEVIETFVRYQKNRIIQAQPKILSLKQIFPPEIVYEIMKSLLPTTLTPSQIHRIINELPNEKERDQIINSILSDMRCKTCHLLRDPRGS